MSGLIEIEFWPSHKADIDIDLLNNMSVSVKGKRSSNPCRCIEIFGNHDPSLLSSTIECNIDLFNFESIRKYFLPQIPGITFEVNHNSYHPPFIWMDCSPINIAVNFTYNTNAFYRIFSNLAEQGIISHYEIDGLIDKACLVISQIYKIRDGSILKSINNNINMYIISKVVEMLLGKKNYNSENQEPIITRIALHHTLGTISEYEEMTVLYLMALSLGRGVSFYENTIAANKATSLLGEDTDSRTHSYLEGGFAIDHRQHMIDNINERTESGDAVSICVILDDTSESIFDLLWIQKLIKSNILLKVNLLINLVQVSINFSANMLDELLKRSEFKYLSSQINSRLFVFKTYCPLISFQTNLLADDANTVIDKSDLVYIKGLNFFETCQIKRKDTYYAFVVFGPISRIYTGLNDYDAVFSFVPRGETGYVHEKESIGISTLIDSCNSK